MPIFPYHIRSHVTGLRRSDAAIPQDRSAKPFNQRLRQVAPIRALFSNSEDATETSVMLQIPSCLSYLPDLTYQQIYKFHWIGLYCPSMVCVRDLELIGMVWVPAMHFCACPIHCKVHWRVENRIRSHRLILAHPLTVSTIREFSIIFVLFVVLEVVCCLYIEAVSIKLITESYGELLSE